MTEYSNVIERVPVTRVNKLVNDFVIKTCIIGDEFGENCVNTSTRTDISMIKRNKDDFEVEEYIIYQNGDNYELGKIKRLCDDGAFVFYHSGDTAAKTPYDHMFKLTNGFLIKECSLGGN